MQHDYVQYKKGLLKIYMMAFSIPSMTCVFSLNLDNHLLLMKYIQHVSIPFALIFLEPAVLASPLIKWFAMFISDFTKSLK